jgi:hypothetical protein
VSKYIYGLICNPRSDLFDTASFEREVRVNAEFRNLRSATQVEPERLTAIRLHDIAAIVSDSNISDCSHLLKDALGRLLVQHQRVVEAVMALGYSVVPMKLGTFAQDESEVKEILRRGHDLIRAVSDKVADRIEVDVVATWADLNQVLSEIARRPEIVDVKARLMAKPEGVSLEDKLRVGEAVKRLLDRTRVDHAQEIREALAGLSADVREHDLMDDKMVCNAAFLLDRSRQSRFDHAVNELDARYLGRLNFRCVGPLPAYSFFTLEARKLQFDKVDWARRKLGLVQDSATRDEIRSAHRRLAMTSHPDRNSGSVSVGREFDEITRAYRTLDEYCQDERCSFDLASFQERSIQVCVRN